MFDSMHDDISDDTINQICCIACTRKQSIKVGIVDVCKQEGAVDCGLFALANATTLCQGELPQSKQYIQSAMRPHLIRCFKESSPSAFPAKPRNLCGDHIKKTKVISVHCSCHLPED